MARRIKRNLPFTIYHLPFIFQIEKSANQWKMEDRKRKIATESGQLLVELLVAFGIASILIPAIIFGFISGSSGRVQQEQRLKATGLLKEGEEAARSLRDADWSNVATNGTYYPKVSGSSWVWGTVTDGSIADLTRTVVISDVSPADISKKQITVTVAWNNIFPSNLSSTFILARWKNTSSSLISAGTLINQGNGDWCAPTLSLGSIDLGNATPFSISAIQGQVTTGTGQAAAGFTFVDALMSDPPAPATPSATAINTYNGPTKTNNVFTLANYAFIATDSHSKVVDIINLNSVSGGKYSEAGFFSMGGGAKADTVVASPSTGYFTVGNMLYDFSLSGLPNTSTSRVAIHPAGLQLPASATKMVVYGNRLYISTTSTTYQLVVVDAANLTFISKPVAAPGKIGVNGLGGKSVYVNSTGTRVYLATASSATLKEMFIVNVDETSAGFGNTVGSYDTNGMNPTGIVLTNLPKVIIVGTGGQQYQVVDVTDETNPSECGNLTTAGDLNGVATVFTTAQRAYSYIIANTNSNQLKIIEGGPGGNGSGGGLTVESPTLDAGHSVTFNRIDVTSLTPTGITATYQVAVSTDCSTYNYSGNYTTAGGSIPINLNPGQCFRYKVTFSGGSGGGSAVSTTVSINYSP